MTDKYNVGPSTGDEMHHYASFVCVVHCGCNDHYYRCRDCKHVRDWLTACDALRGEAWYRVDN